MKITTICLFILLTITLISSKAYSQSFDYNGFVISGIKTKIRGQVDDEGEIWFAIKADVKDVSCDSSFVSFELQAVDAEGFELHTIHISGKIFKRSTSTLSTKDYMPYEEYQKIAEWKIKGLPDVTCQTVNKKNKKSKPSDKFK